MGTCIYALKTNEICAIKFQNMQFEKKLYPHMLDEKMFYLNEHCNYKNTLKNGLTKNNNKKMLQCSIIFRH